MIAAGAQEWKKQYRKIAKTPGKITSTICSSTTTITSSSPGIDFCNCDLSGENEQQAQSNIGLLKWESAIATS
jgi:hypothetical protein